LKHVTSLMFGLRTTVLSSSPAGPRIASGNSLQQGRNPSTSPDTSSKHTTPVVKG